MATQVANRRVALAVGIVLLAIGTVAVISIVKQRGEAARHNEVTKIANERLKEMEAEGAPLKQGSKDSEQKNDTTGTGNSGQQGAKDGQQAGQQGAQQGTSSSDSTGDRVATVPQTGVASEEEAGPTASELPQTGPEVIWSLLPVGALTFALAAYVQSRRI